MTRTAQETCIVSAVPPAHERAHPGVIPAGAPLRFHWRGCEYRVTDILTSWVETGPWWYDLQGSLAGVGAVGSESVPARSAAGSERRWAGDGGPAPTGAERRVWQVEAVRHPRGSHPGVYELAQESQTGRWWLTRVWD